MLGNLLEACIAGVHVKCGHYEAHHVGRIVGSGQEAVRRTAATDQHVLDLEPPDCAARAQVRRAVPEVNVDARGPNCYQARFCRQVHRRGPRLGAFRSAPVLQPDVGHVSSLKIRQTMQPLMQLSS